MQKGGIGGNESEGFMTKANFNVDTAHSGIYFTVSHLVVAKIRGAFRKWSAELTIDETDVTKSSVVVEIDAASVDTGNAQRDADLRSVKFFDTENYPVLAFRSRRVDRMGENACRVTGDLTIRGVTRSAVLVVIPGGFVTDPWGGRRAGFTATTSLERSAFGMVWNQALDGGGVFVGDGVDIAIEIEAVSQTATSAA